MKAPTARLAVVAIGVSFLVACGADEGADGGSTTRSRVGSVDGPVLTSSDFEDADQMAAEVTGQVKLDARTGCLLLSSGENGYPVVWPYGTTWQSEARAVVLGSGQVVPLGAHVYGGGGYLQRDLVAHIAGEQVANAADACAGPTGEVALFNPNSEVTLGADGRPR